MYKQLILDITGHRLIFSQYRKWNSTIPQFFIQRFLHSPISVPSVSKFKFESKSKSERWKWKKKKRKKWHKIQKLTSSLFCSPNLSTLTRETKNSANSSSDTNARPIRKLIRAIVERDGINRPVMLRRVLARMERIAVREEEDGCCGLKHGAYCCGGRNWQ